MESSIKAKPFPSSPTQFRFESSLRSILRLFLVQTSFVSQTANKERRKQSAHGQKSRRKLRKLSECNKCSDSIVRRIFVTNLQPNLCVNDSSRLDSPTETKYHFRFLVSIKDEPPRAWEGCSESQMRFLIRRHRKSLLKPPVS